MALEVLGFHSKEQRDEQYRKWKEEGSKGVVKFTTHVGNEPQIVYSVTRTEPIEIKTVAESVDIATQQDD